ncbi:MAG TPA: hypothetical protein VI485_31335 [Vicinamibacterales bacterium]|nr:hypothetical protein [Vicinamibacterales bacterium]
MPCGQDITPEKAMMFVDQRRLDLVSSRRQVRVDLGPAFLAARAIALVKFES